MAILADIKTLLIAVSSTIKLSEMPDAPDDCLALFLTGGFDPSHSFDKRQFSEPTIQARARSMSPATAETMLQQCKALLDGQTGLTINGTTYQSIFQQGDILQLGKDARGRFECTVNFRIKVNN